MRTLRFAKDVYAESALDQALEIFAPHASIERTDEGGAWLVKLSAKSPATERRLAGELANYALGVTIENRKSQPGSSAKASDKGAP